jgi:hypothetical protein
MSSDETNTPATGKDKPDCAPRICSAADEYLKTHKSAKWCPVCGFIYFMRFAPVLTTLTLICAGIIGGCIGHHAASR